MWNPSLGDTEYQNPVLYADYSDPDVIRVGDDFFLVASSFNNVPGLPVLHSKDLIHWRIINHAVSRLPFARYNSPLYGNGIWAPAIRFHEGLYRIFVPFPDEGIYETHTRDPFGEWSELHCVREASGWIDPCPFWDDDGQAYMAHAYARSRAGINSILAISRMKPDCTGLLDDEPTIVYDGHATQPTIEGPKLYKRNGWYYIFAPAGGVSTGWQTILRSRSIMGPYEEKIVMRQGNTPVNGPHQGAWVDTKDGEDWFLHFQELQPYGRIVHLQPMRWEADWPVIGIHQDENGAGEPVLRWKKPGLLKAQDMPPQDFDTFEGPALGLQWQWNANPQPNWYTLGAEGLRLNAVCENPKRLWDASNLLMQKYSAPMFTIRVEMDGEKMRMLDEFGLVLMGEQYAALCVTREETGWTLRMRDGAGRSGLPGRMKQTAEDEKADNYTPCLHTLATSRCTLIARVARDGLCVLSAQENGQAERPLAVRSIPRAPLFIGARFGVYLFRDKEHGGSAAIRQVLVSDVSSLCPFYGIHFI